jgi:predicted ATPase
MMLLDLEEDSLRKQSLPAPLMSDGTMTSLALLVALHFEGKPFLLIEEPERNLHPKLLAKVVKLMKDVSRDRQLLVTTHSPEFVRQTEVANLFLLARDGKGNSVVTRPAESEDVRRFLQEQVGLGELLTQDLLGP